MTRGPLLRSGDHVGPYRLTRRLGRGGNATVWAAKHEETGDAVAIKVLYSVNAGSVGYERFRREVDQQGRALASHAGVLPVIASHVPEDPSDDNPAYLVLPIALLLRRWAGQEAMLDDIVGALSQVATTLADIAELGMAHRDVKPENLYHFRDQAVVGDFGLISVPDARPLTTGVVGPRYYLAPEMILDPINAEGRPADVYSLGKTIWVFVTGQQVPPPGELRVEYQSLRASNYVVDDRAVFIDHLLEAMTNHDPNRRPKMRSVANELQAWV